MGENWKCPKCGSSGQRKRELRLRGIMGTAGLLGSEQVTAYVCDGCGYIEFYEGKR